MPGLEDDPDGSQEEAAAVMLYVQSAQAACRPFGFDFRSIFSTSIPI